TRIADYGLIGDCHTAALISRHGSIDWLCTPYFDSPSLFGRLLDAEQAAHFSIQPAAAFNSRSEYVGNSGVLKTTFETGQGRATLTDFMPLDIGKPPRPFARPHATRQLIRIIEGISGEVALQIDIHPRPNYGLDKAGLCPFEQGVLI